MWNAMYPAGRYDFTGSDIIMKSAQKIIKQSIVAPLCCQYLSPWFTFITELGEGYVSDYSVQIFSGVASINLKYSDL